MVRVALFVFISILMSASMTEAIGKLDSCANNAFGRWGMKALASEPGILPPIFFFNNKDPISRGQYTLIILHFIYCDTILDQNGPLTLVSGSFKIRIN